MWSRSHPRGFLREVWGCDATATLRAGAPPSGSGVGSEVAMTQDVGNGSNQPPQRPMWQVQPGPVAGPFSPPPGEGQPGSRAEAQQPQHVAPGSHDGYQEPPLATYQQNAPQHAAPTSYAEPVPPARPMTAQDFLHQRHRTIDIGPATWGWRGWVRTLTFGLVKPKMGPA